MDSRFFALSPLSVNSIRKQLKQLVRSLSPIWAALLKAPIILRKVLRWFIAWLLPEVPSLKCYYRTTYKEQPVCIVVIPDTFIPSVNALYNDNVKSGLSTYLVEQGLDQHKPKIFIYSSYDLVFSDTDVYRPSTPNDAQFLLSHNRTHASSNRYQQYLDNPQGSFVAGRYAAAYAKKTSVGSLFLGQDLQRLEQAERISVSMAYFMSTMKWTIDIATMVAVSFADVIYSTGSISSILIYQSIVKLLNQSAEWLRWKPNIDWVSWYIPSPIKKFYEYLLGNVIQNLKHLPAVFPETKDLYRSWMNILDVASIYMHNTFAAASPYGYYRKWKRKLGKAALKHPFLAAALATIIGSVGASVCKGVVWLILSALPASLIIFGKYMIGILIMGLFIRTFYRKVKELFWARISNNERLLNTLQKLEDENAKDLEFPVANEDKTSFSQDFKDRILEAQLDAAFGLHTGANASEAGLEREQYFAEKNMLSFLDGKRLEIDKAILQFFASCHRFFLPRNPAMVGNPQNYFETDSWQAIEKTGNSIYSGLFRVYVWQPMEQRVSVLIKNRAWSALVLPTRIKVGLTLFAYGLYAAAVIPGLILYDLLCQTHKFYQRTTWHGNCMQTQFEVEDAAKSWAHAQAVPDLLPVKNVAILYLSPLHAVEFISSCKRLGTEQKNR